MYSSFRLLALTALVLPLPHSFAQTSDAPAAADAQTPAAAPAVASQTPAQKPDSHPNCGAGGPGAAYCSIGPSFTSCSGGTYACCAQSGASCVLDEASNTIKRFGDLQLTGTEFSSAVGTSGAAVVKATSSSNGSQVFLTLASDTDKPMEAAFVFTPKDAAQISFSGPGTVLLNSDGVSVILDDGRAWMFDLSGTSKAAASNTKIVRVTSAAEYLGGLTNPYLGSSHDQFILRRCAEHPCS